VAISRFDRLPVEPSAQGVDRTALALKKTVLQ